MKIYHVTNDNLLFDAVVVAETKTKARAEATAHFKFRGKDITPAAEAKVIEIGTYTGGNDIQHTIIVSEP